MGFNYSRTLTIDHTKCGSSSSSSFPVLVSATDSTLKSVANGGHVTDSGGSDILFFSDAAGTTQLPSEIDFYDPVNGVLVAWVQLTTVSNTVDTLFYLFYGNSSAPVRTTNPWDVNSVGVWHLSNGTVLSGADSSSSGNTLVNSGMSAATGLIDGGVSNIGTANKYMSVASPANIYNTAAATISGWVFLISAGASGTAILSVGSKQLKVNSTQTIQVSQTTSNSFRQSISTNTVPLSTWVYLAVTCTNLTSTGTAWLVYLNGTQVSYGTQLVGSGTPTSDTGILTIGTIPSNTAAFNINGSLDEIRYSSAARSADWILTSFNNQNAPGNIGSPNFLTWGSEIVVSSGANIINLMGIKMGMSIS